ncbi:hypothetical protein SUGI_0506380 [Cryptomeria japonica]|nr:hypothetical protein SUGI_0506380 [Cryptomeria japonica]
MNGVWGKGSAEGQGGEQGRWIWSLKKPLDCLWCQTEWRSLRQYIAHLIPRADCAFSVVYRFTPTCSVSSPINSSFGGPRLVKAMQLFATCYAACPLEYNNGYPFTIAVNSYASFLITSDCILRFEYTGTAPQMQCWPFVALGRRLMPCSRQLMKQPIHYSPATSVPQQKDLY